MCSIRNRDNRVFVSIMFYPLRLLHSGGHGEKREHDGVKSKSPDGLERRLTNNGIRIVYTLYSTMYSTMFMHKRYMCVCRCAHLFGGAATTPSEYELSPLSLLLVLWRAL